jgi:hypothetical protein
VSWLASEYPSACLKLAGGHAVFGALQRLAAWQNVVVSSFALIAFVSAAQADCQHLSNIAAAHDLTPVLRFICACSKRAFIVTDPPLFEMGITTQLVNKLIPLGIQPKTFTNVEPDPTLGMVQKAMEELRSFKPDLIIAIGGGSPMDAAKLM